MFKGKIINIHKCIKCVSLIAYLFIKSIIVIVNMLQAPLKLDIFTFYFLHTIESY